jgi:hypothetical protein
MDVAKRACVFGAGVHVGQARDFVFVEVAPCLCGSWVCGGLFELPPVLFRRVPGGYTSADALRNPSELWTSQQEQYLRTYGESAERLLP